MIKQVQVGNRELTGDNAAVQIFAVDQNNNGTINIGEVTTLLQVQVGNRTYAW